MNRKQQMSPVFLLGAGRSGTKFLRDILGVSQEIAIIPYDVGYVWRYGNDSCPHDELTPDMLNPSIEKFIKKTLPKLVENSSKSHASIFIEKSVPNTLRPAFVHALYPDAKFIHLIRDGRAVTESALRLWITPPKKSYLLKKLKYFPLNNYKYALNRIQNIIIGNLSKESVIHSWGPRYQGIDEDIKTLPLELVCAKQWKKCVEVSLEQLANINPNNIIEVRYEELMKDAKTLDSICDFLNIRDKKHVLNNYENIVNRDNLEKWEKQLSTKQKKLISKEISDLLSHLGYL